MHDHQEHVIISVVGCQISSVDGVAEVKENNATIIFSAQHVPVNDEIKFHCRLDGRRRYKACKWCDTQLSIIALYSVSVGTINSKVYIIRRYSILCSMIAKRWIVWQKVILISEDR